MIGGGQVERVNPAFGPPRSITFYCGSSEHEWDPDSLFDGIGGSEEALILLSRQLAALGFQVKVFASPRGGARRFGDVWWLPHDQFEQGNVSRIFVAWRKAEFLPLGKHAEIVCHWVHDRLDFGYPEEAVPLVDRIFMVSSHQASGSGLSAADARLIHVCKNGLDEQFLRPAGSNESTRVIYASCPARGLVTLLKMWPSVRSRIPAAELEVFHGFTPAYADAARIWPGLELVRVQVLRLVERLANQGVTFHGMVGQHRLAEGFARAGVWAYPTHCCETSCITAMKALAMGCLPVTTRMCALRETLGPWDLGPPATDRIHASWWQRRLYLKTLLRAMQPDPALDVANRRLAAAAWARRRYSWRAVAADWQQVLDEAASAKRLKGGGVKTSGKRPVQTV